MWQYTGGFHDTGKEVIPGLPLSEAAGIIAYNGKVMFSINTPGKSGDTFEHAAELVKWLNENKVKPVKSELVGHTFPKETFVK